MINLELTGLLYADDVTPKKMFHLIFTDPTPAWWKKCLEANGKSGQSVNTICPARSVARKRKANLLSPYSHILPFRFVPSSSSVLA